MQIRLSVLPPTRDTEPVDVVVTAPTGTPLSAVANGLRGAAGVTTAGRFHAGEHLVAPEAVLGEPPLVDGALLTLDRPGAPALPDRAVELHVVGGPDAGGVHMLQPGRVRIGRSPDADIRIADPDLSRFHAELVIEPDWIGVRDLGSTNGTTLDGAAVGETAALMLPGALLRVGESSLALAVPDWTGRTGHPDGTGRLEIARGQHRPQVPEWVTVTAEPAPKPRRGGLTGSRRRTAAADHARAVDLRSRIDAAVGSEARLRRTEHPDAAATLLTALHLGPRLWERDTFGADGLTVRLGTRAAPAHVRVVQGPEAPPERPQVPDVPVAVSLAKAGSLGVVGPRRRTTALVRYLVAQLAVMYPPEELEIVLLCRDGTRGSDAAAWSWARWLPHLRSSDESRGRLLIGLEPPQIEARVVPLLARLRDRDRQTSDDAGAGGGTGHGADSPGASPDRAAMAAPSPAGPVRRTVLVVDNPGVLRLEPGVARLLAEGPSVGIHPVCLGEDEAEIRNACRAVATVTGEVTTRLRLETPGAAPVEDIVADLVSPAWAERVARALAPLRQPRSGTLEPPLPGSTRLLDLLRLDLLTPAKLLTAWEERPRSAGVVLGADSRGICGVELGADAGHMVVLGAPGSGKTELLRAMVAGLAVANRPDETGLVLVSAVGKPSFGECVELPHVVGSVSGCTPIQLEQVFAVLGSELDRRAGLLRTARAAGFGDYQRSRAEDAHQPAGRGTRQTALAPLARLVVVIDEVASLLTTRPGLAKTLADIARQGRHLGLHLILSATARAGAEDRLFPEVTALTGPPLSGGQDRLAIPRPRGGLAEELDTRVVLRMPGPGAAAEAVGTAEAAYFPEDNPGRGLLLAGRHDPVLFQGAQVTGRMPSSSTLRPSVARQDWRELGSPSLRGRSGREGGGPTDLALLAGAIRRATLSGEITLPPPLWG